MNQIAVLFFTSLFLATKESGVYQDKWGNIRYRDSDKTVAWARDEYALSILEEL